MPISTGNGVTIFDMSTFNHILLCKCHTLHSPTLTMSVHHTQLTLAAMHMSHVVCWLQSTVSAPAERTVRNVFKNKPNRFYTPLLHTPCPHPTPHNSHPTPTPHTPAHAYCCHRIQYTLHSLPHKSHTITHQHCFRQELRSRKLPHEAPNMGREHSHSRKPAGASYLVVPNGLLHQQEQPQSCTNWDINCEKARSDLRKAVLTINTSHRWSHYNGIGETTTWIGRPFAHTST